MALKIVCPKCSSSLRIGAVAPGKKIRCPKCQNVFLPVAEEEPEIAEEVEEAVTAKPPAKKRKVDVVEEVVEEVDEIDEDEDDGRRKRKKKKSGDWQPCPKCDRDNIKKVVWTMWGSFYGPALLSHVRCLDCGYKYNGRTGRSNLIGAIIFVSVPLIGMAIAIGWIGWKIYKTYVLMQD